LSRYGGIGGAGGNIYLVAKDGLTLENVANTLKTKRVVADCGHDSSARGIIGAPGQDKNISVPRGILVYNQNGVLLGRYFLNFLLKVVQILLLSFLPLLKIL